MDSLKFLNIHVVVEFFWIWCLFWYLRIFPFRTWRNLWITQWGSFVNYVIFAKGFNGEGFSEFGMYLYDSSWRQGTKKPSPPWAWRIYECPLKSSLGFIHKLRKIGFRGVKPRWIFPWLFKIICSLSLSIIIPLTPKAWPNLWMSLFGIYS